MEKEYKFVFLAAVFIAALVAGAMLGGKITTILGLTFSVSAITYALTFPMTDVVGEVWGKKKAHYLVWAGFVGAIIATLLVWLAINLPSAPFWQNQEAYKQTLGIVWRLVLGGLIAYIVSQHHDVWAFHFWKKKLKGKHLWFRNNASTWVSQLIDTVIFITIAFYGILPNNVLLPTMFGQYVVKIIIAAIDTPIVYLLVAWVKR